MFAKEREDIVEAGEMIPGFWQADTIVMGCGNRLLGDDGFGPAVIAHLQDHYRVLSDVVLLDAGTGISRLLFDIALAPSPPRRLVVVDAMRLGLPPGTVSTLLLDSVRLEKVRTFADHQEPTSCLLKELRDMSGIEVTLFVAEPEFVPQEVTPGLSPAIHQAVIKVCEFIVSSLYRNSLIPVES